VDEAVKRFIVRNREHIGRIVCFGTSALTGSVRKPMQRIASALDVYIDGAEFHCRGSFGPLHMGHPNREDLRRAAAFARYVIGE